MNIGEKIKCYRQLKGLTQKQLGKLCGMSDSAIRRYENNRGNPTIETLKRITDALNIRICDLCSEEQADKKIPMFKEGKDCPVVRSGVIDDKVEVRLFEVTTDKKALMFYGKDEDLIADVIRLGALYPLMEWFNNG